MLAQRFAHPKLGVALTLGGAWLAYFAVSGALFPSETSATWTSPRQVTGMALMFAILPAYLAAFYVYTAARAAESVEQLRPLFTGPEAEALAGTVDRLRPASFWAATLVGFVIGCFNVDWRAVSTVGRAPHWPMDLSLVLGSMAVWILAAQLIYGRSHTALVFARLGRSGVAVDLFQPAQLRPFARVGIVDFLLAMGALALTPLQALDAEFRWFNYSFAFAVVLPAAAFLLVMPMWGVHRTLQAAKARALAAVESDISGASREHEPQALLALNGLLERRRFLQHVNTWPMDLRAVSRVGFYLIIPPLAWVAAALVEIAVEALVGAR